MPQKWTSGFLLSPLTTNYGNRDRKGTRGTQRDGIIETQFEREEALNNIPSSLPCSPEREPCNEPLRGELKFMAALINLASPSFAFADKPLFPQEPSDGSLKVIAVEEGKSLLINLTAKANPSADLEYKWTNPDKATLPSAADAMPGSRLVAAAGLLNVTDAQRGDHGKYKVRAANAEGKTTMKFKLDVHYRPR